MENRWFAMCCAPRDGTKIILLGPMDGWVDVDLAAWEETDADSDDGTLTHMWCSASGALGGDDAFIGWIPCPAFKLIENP